MQLSPEPFACRPGKRARAALVVLMLAATGLFARHARADALSDLEKAHSAYVAHKYAEAESRLHALLDPRTGGLSDSDKVADARMYLGATLLALGKKDQAAALFEQLLLEKPDYQPDSLRVSLQATDALIDARSRLREQLAANMAERVRRAQEERAKADAERQRAALHLAMLEKLASEETVVQRSSRVLALLPFGVGQFQNGQRVLGWVFLTGESLLALGSVSGGALTLYNAGQASDALGRNDLFTAETYQQRAQVAALTGNLFTAGLALATVVGIVQAQLAFVPERVEVHKRALPPIAVAPRIAPVAALPSVDAGGDRGRGVVFGLQGRF